MHGEEEAEEEKREEPVLLLPKLEFTHPHHHYPSSAQGVDLERMIDR